LFPASRTQVLQMMDAGTITPFHVQTFFDGHGPTNYSQWYHRTATTSITGGDGGDEQYYYPITYAPKYEPYVLGYRHHHPPSSSSSLSSSSLSSTTTILQQQQQNQLLLPPYWTGFYGFGFDKYSWFLELHYSGYQFAVLYDVAIFHLDHPYRDGHALSAHNRRQMELFVLHLLTKYQAPALEFDEDFDIQTTTSSTTDNDGNSNYNYTVTFRKIKDKRRRNKRLEKVAAEAAAKEAAATRKETKPSGG
jgi:hypothetical protein